MGGTQGPFPGEDSKEFTDPTFQQLRSHLHRILLFLAASQGSHVIHEPEVRLFPRHSQLLDVDDPIGVQRFPDQPFGLFLIHDPNLPEFLGPAARQVPVEKDPEGIRSRSAALGGGIPSASHLIRPRVSWNCLVTRSSSDSRLCFSSWNFFSCLAILTLRRLRVDWKLGRDKEPGFGNARMWGKLRNGRRFPGWVLPVDFPLLQGSERGILHIQLPEHIQVVFQLHLVQVVNPLHLPEFLLQVLEFHGKKSQGQAGSLGKTQGNPQNGLDPPGKKPGIKSQQGQPTVFSLSRGRRKATIQGLIPKIPPQAAIQRQILNNCQGSPSHFQALPAWNSHPKSQFQLQFSLPRFWGFFPSAAGTENSCSSSLWNSAFVGINVGIFYTYLGKERFLISHGKHSLE